MVNPAGLLMEGDVLPSEFEVVTAETSALGISGEGALDSLALSSPSNCISEASIGIGNNLGRGRGGKTQS